MAALDYKETQWLKSSLASKKAIMEEKGYFFPNKKLDRRIAELTNDPRKAFGF